MCPDISKQHLPATHQDSSIYQGRKRNAANRNKGRTHHNQLHKSPREIERELSYLKLLPSSTTSSATAISMNQVNTMIGALTNLTFPEKWTCASRDEEALTGPCQHVTVAAEPDSMPEPPKVVAGTEYVAHFFDGLEWIVGKLQALWKLEQGGQGTAWVCKVAGSDEKVVVKVPIEYRDNIPLQRELNSLLKLQGRDSVVKALGWVNLGEMDQSMTCAGGLKEFRGIILEYCQGGDLWWHVGDRSRYEVGKNATTKYMNVGFTDVQRYFMVKQIVEGLIALNEQGLVHCDLKLTNVLVTSPQKRNPSDTKSLYRVKVSDLGIAQKVSVSEPSMLDIGSCYYMSPEQARARVSNEGFWARPQCDSWALGCVIGELCCGSHLFHDKTDDKQLLTIYGTKKFFQDTRSRMNANVHLEHKWLDLMQRCFELHAEKRITPKEILKVLTTSKDFTGERVMLDRIFKEEAQALLQAAEAKASAQAAEWYMEECASDDEEWKGWGNCSSNDAAEVLLTVSGSSIDDQACFTSSANTSCSTNEAPLPQLHETQGTSFFDSLIAGEQIVIPPAKRHLPPIARAPTKQITTCVTTVKATDNSHVWASCADDLVGGGSSDGSGSERSSISSLGSSIDVPVSSFFEDDSCEIAPHQQSQANINAVMTTSAAPPSDEIASLATTSFFSNPLGQDDAVMKDTEKPVSNIAIQGQHHEFSQVQEGLVAHNNPVYEASTAPTFAAADPCAPRTPPRAVSPPSAAVPAVPAAQSSPPTAPLPPLMLAPEAPAPETPSPVQLLVRPPTLAAAAPAKAVTATRAAATTCASIPPPPRTVPLQTQPPLAAAPLLCGSSSSPFPLTVNVATPAIPRAPTGKVATKNTITGFLYGAWGPKARFSTAEDIENPTPKAHCKPPVKQQSKVSPKVVKPAESSAKVSSAISLASATANVEMRNQQSTWFAPKKRASKKSSGWGLVGLIACSTTQVSNSANAAKQPARSLRELQEQQLERLFAIV